LQNIVKSSEASWQSIGTAFGKPTDLLFLEFGKDLLENNIKNTKTDPITKENVFSHIELKPYESNILLKILDYSIIKQEKNIQKEKTIKISGDNLLGTMYFIAL